MVELTNQQMVEQTRQQIASPEQWSALRDELLRQSFLFDDPMAYEAGVRDAFRLLSPVGNEHRNGLT
jgi:hypothetical protein